MNCTLTPLKPTDQKKLREFSTSDARALLHSVAVTLKDDAMMLHTAACLKAPDTQTGQEMAMATFKKVARYNTFLDVLDELKDPALWNTLEIQPN